MINSIAWNKECLKNMKAGLERNKIYLVKLTEEVHQQELDVSFYQKQIETAEKENKTSFDRDRYLVKRKNKDENT